MTAAHCRGFPCPARPVAGINRGAVRSPAAGRDRRAAVNPGGVPAPGCVQGHCFPQDHTWVTTTSSGAPCRAHDRCGRTAWAASMIPFIFSFLHHNTQVDDNQRQPGRDDSRPGPLTVTARQQTGRSHPGRWRNNRPEGANTAVARTTPQRIRRRRSTTHERDQRNHALWGRARPPPGHGEVGFCPVSLGDWLELCRQAGVPHVPAEKICELLREDCLSFDAPGEHRERLRAAFQEMERARLPGRMMRFDYCAGLDIKSSLAQGEAGVPARVPPGSNWTIPGLSTSSSSTPGPGPGRRSG